MNTSIPITDAWSGFGAHVPTNYGLAFIALVNCPLIVILLNILWQLVRIPSILLVFYLYTTLRCLLAIHQHPQWFFIGCLSLALRLHTEMIPLIFSSNAGKRSEWYTLSEACCSTCLGSMVKSSRSS